MPIHEQMCAHAASRTTYTHIRYVHCFKIWSTGNLNIIAASKWNMPTISSAFILFFWLHAFSRCVWLSVYGLCLLCGGVGANRAIRMQQDIIWKCYQLHSWPNGRHTIYSLIQGGSKTNMVYTWNSSHLQRGHCVMMRRNKHKHLRGDGNAHVFTRLRKLTDHRSLIFVCLRFSSIKDKCTLRWGHRFRANTQRKWTGTQYYCMCWWTLNRMNRMTEIFRTSVVFT